MKTIHMVLFGREIRITITVKQGEQWSKDMIVSELQRISSAGGSTTLCDLPSGLLSAIYNLYRGGSKPPYEMAVEDAGLVSKRKRAYVPLTVWTSERILSELRRLHSQGVEMRPSAIKKASGALYGAIANGRYFKEASTRLRFQQAIHEAGFEMAAGRGNRGNKWSRAIIISVLRERGKSGVGLNPKTMSLSLAGAIRWHFRGEEPSPMHAALEAAGFEPQEILWKRNGEG